MGSELSVLTNFKIKKIIRILKQNLIFNFFITGLRNDWIFVEIEIRRFCFLLILFFSRNN